MPVNKITPELAKRLAAEGLELRKEYHKRLLKMWDMCIWKKL